MKKVFLLLAVLALNLSVAAQEHLTFKGVPIDGTRQSFVQKLKEKGFTYLYERDLVLMTGTFAGYHDCTIIISSLKDKNLVYSVIVMFPKEYVWSHVFSTYSTLKLELTRKYGNPFVEVEKFKDEHIDSDMMKMLALSNGECEWNTCYLTASGKIILSISSTEYGSACVGIAYIDAINEKIANLTATDDL